MDFTLYRDSSTPLYLQIKNNIKTMILSGELYDGMKLPSVRKLAEALGVHRNTITRAYDELKADALITSHKGHGYYVYFPQTVENPSSSKVFLSWKNIFNEEYMMRQIYNSYERRFLEDVQFSFSGFYDNKDIRDYGIMNQILLKIALDNDPKKFLMEDTLGDVHLRKAVAAFFRRKGMDAKENEIKVVSNILQVIEYIAQLLMKAGDVVLTTETIAPDICRIYNALGIKVFSVPMDQKGICCDKLEAMIQKYKPKLLHVEPEFHNPTGIEMSLQRRKELVELAHRYHLVVLEEAGTEDIRFTNKKNPPLKALDRYHNVIFIYDCWYVLPSGLQMTFVHADKVLIKNLSLTMVLRLIRESSITQKIIAEYISIGRYEEKLKLLSLEYKLKMDAVCEIIKAKDPEKEYVSYNKPNGGPNLWLTLLRRIKKSTLLDSSKKESISFITGESFYPDGGPDKMKIRINLSDIRKADVEPAMKKLMDIIIANSCE